VEPHSSAHVHVEGDGGGPRLHVEEGLTEGGVLPAAVEDDLQEGGDEAVPAFSTDERSRSTCSSSKSLCFSRSSIRLDMV